MNRRAFTLIEMLVVTAVMGLVIACVGACLAGGIRVWESTRTFNRVESEVYYALHVMERDLHNTFAFHGVPFSGGSGAATFPAWYLAPEAEAVRRIGAVQYTFDPYAGVLLRGHWAFPDSPNALSGEPLIQGVRRFGLRYRGGAPGRLGGWQEQWSDPTNHPHAVEVSIAMEGRDDTEPYEKTIVMPVDWGSR